MQANVKWLYSDERAAFEATARPEIAALLSLPMRRVVPLGAPAPPPSPVRSATLAASPGPRRLVRPQRPRPCTCTALLSPRLASPHLPPLVSLPIGRLHHR
eukprot:1187890-Prymnesium_polylepis.1